MALTEQRTTATTGSKTAGQSGRAHLPRAQEASCQHSSERGTVGAGPKRDRRAHLWLEPTSEGFTATGTGISVLARCPREPRAGSSGGSAGRYQVHGVELDSVLLGVPLCGHCDSQGLAGDSEELGLGSFQLPVVQVDLKATLKDQTRTSQGLRGIE